MYAQLQANLLGSHRLRALKVRLRLNLAGAVGYLSVLWIWCVQSYPDGNLGDIDGAVLEDLLDWQGEPGQLFAALVETGWLEEGVGGWRVHGWEEHTGRGLSLRAREAERKREERKQRTERRASPKKSPGTPKDSPEASEDSPRMSRDTPGQSPDRPPPTETVTETVTGTETETKDPPCSPPTGGPPHGPDSDPPKRKPGKKRATPDQAAAHIRSLLELPWEDHPTALEAFRGKFPAFDGRNGRPTLASKILAIEDWARANVAKSMKRSTPAFVENWLSKDYGSVRYSYDRDAEKGRVPGTVEDSSLGKQTQERLRREEAEARRIAEEIDAGFNPAEYLDQMRGRRTRAESDSAPHTHTPHQQGR